MYCPQCGTESVSTLQFCRSCGANLKVIGKAVALSEVIARSDRGPLPKIREMVKGLKVDKVTEDVSSALEKMKQEIAQISPKSSEPRALISLGRKKTPEEKREAHISKGIVSFFSGIGLTVFLYFLSAALVLKLPPRIIEQIPFEIDPVVRMIWMFGLLPTLTGLGHIMAGLLIRPSRTPALPENKPVDFPYDDSRPKTIQQSVTENTTNLLEPDRFQSTNRI